MGYRWRVPRRGSRQKLATWISRRELRARGVCAHKHAGTAWTCMGPGSFGFEVGQMPAGNARQMYHYLGLTVAMQLESVNRDPHHQWRQRGFRDANRQGWGRGGGGEKDWKEKQNGKGNASWRKRTEKRLRGKKKKRNRV